MRIGYMEDENFPGQFHLWEANCQRSMCGRKGQAALRELEGALMAMPEKRLIAEELVTSHGVCAVGQLALTIALRRGESEDQARKRLIQESLDNYDTANYAAEKLGVPRLVAWQIVCENDDLFEHVSRMNSEETPEQRYDRVLAWVRSQLDQTRRRTARA